MNLEAIVIANGFGITLMIMLRICAGRGIRRNDLADRIFDGLIYATICLCGLEMASFCIDGKIFPGCIALAYTLNTFLFGINIVYVFLWAIYIDFKLFGDKKRSRRISVPLSMPSAAVVILLLVNLKVPLIFSVSKANIYAREKLVWLPFVVSFFYLGLSEVEIHRNRKNARQYLMLPTMLFLFPIISASIVQLLIYGISITWAALSVALVSVYLNIQCEFSSLDALSGLFSRQYLDDYMRRKEKARGDQSELVGLMIDIDRFKHINDVYGHQAGDQAIRDFARLLRITAGKKDLVARYGGDEFVILLEQEGKEGLDRLIEELNQQVDRFNREESRPYQISFSVGVGHYRQKENTTEDFLREMDISMYKCKKEKSKKLPERRDQ